MFLRKSLFSLAAIAIYALVIVIAGTKLIYIRFDLPMYSLCGLILGLMPSLYQFTLGKPRLYPMHMPTFILGCITLTMSVIGLFAIRIESPAYDLLRIPFTGAAFLIGLSIYNTGKRTTHINSILCFIVVCTFILAAFVLIETSSSPVQKYLIQSRRAATFGLMLMCVTLGALLPMNRFVRPIPAAILGAVMLTVGITSMLLYGGASWIRSSFASFCNLILIGKGTFSISGTIGLYAGVTGMLLRQAFSKETPDFTPAQSNDA